MARATFEAWIPEQWGSVVLMRVAQMSAVEAWARREPMTTNLKAVPRSAGMDVGVVAKGAAYTEDTNTNDSVVLTAAKLGKAIRIADEDIQDTITGSQIVDGKKRDWATSYAKFLDNAALGVNAASNGTTIPFNSVYWTLTNADATTGYSANANYVKTAGALSYTELSNLFGFVETGDYFNEADMVVCAHPSFRAGLRGVLDSQNRPIFVEYTAGTPSTLFNIPVHWTLGAKTSATATSANAAVGTTKGTAGNPLIIVGARDQLILGIRSGPESFLSDPHNGGPGQLTDEWLLNIRSRRGFAVGNPFAFAALEQTTA